MHNILSTLNNLFDDIKKFSKFSDLLILQCSGSNPWDIEIKIRLNNHTYYIRSLHNNDLDLLISLREKLSIKSKDLFCPYPWNNEIKLKSSIQNAIDKSNNHIDVSYLITIEKSIAAHFFLWKINEQDYNNVSVPELGIAVTDQFQNKGLGIIAIRLLQSIANFQNADAIELTTALNNDAGWNMYQKVGFVYTGDIKNPLEVDVTEVIAKNINSEKIRIEHQMVYIINNKRKDLILEYLKNKRIKSDKQYG